MEITWIKITLNKYNKDNSKCSSSQNSINIMILAIISKHQIINWIKALCELILISVKNQKIKLLLNSLYILLIIIIINTSYNIYIF